MFFWFGEVWGSWVALLSTRSLEGLESVSVVCLGVGSPLGRLEQGRRPLARVAVGDGLRPAVSLGEGPLVLRYQAVGASPWRAAWYRAGPDGPLGPIRPLEDYAIIEDPSPGALVVLVTPPGASADALAADVGDGRRAAALGGARVVAFDLLGPAP